MPILFEVYTEIGRVENNTEKVLLTQFPSDFGGENAEEANLLRTLIDFSFSAPNPVVKSSDGSVRYSAVQYTYVLEEYKASAAVKSKDASDAVITRHYVFCLQCEDGLTTHCISSPFPYFRSFNKILSNISHARHNGYDNDVRLFFEALEVTSTVPKFGMPTAIRVPSSISRQQVSIEHENPFRLPGIMDNEHLGEFYMAFGTAKGDQHNSAHLLIQIFAHLLLERRFIVTSNNVRRFTGCCYALAAILFPFKWNHAFVPLLFPKIIEMAGLPKPFIMGMHKEHLPRAMEYGDSDDNHVVVLDVDAGTVSCAYAEADVDLLPKDVRALLEVRLSRSDMISSSDYFSRAFMDSIALLLGDYSKFFERSDTTGEIEFSWQSYVNSQKPDHRRFAGSIEGKLGMVKEFILSRRQLLRRSKPIPSEDEEFERSVAQRDALQRESRTGKNRAEKIVGGIRNLVTTRMKNTPSPTAAIMAAASNAATTISSLALQQSAATASLPVTSGTDGFSNTEVIRNYKDITADDLDIPSVAASFQAPPPPRTPSPPPLPIPVANLIDFGDEDEDEVQASSNSRQSTSIDPTAAMFDPLLVPRRPDSSVTTSSSGFAENEERRISKTAEIIERVLALHATPPSPGSALSGNRPISTLFPGMLPVQQPFLMAQAAVPSIYYPQPSVALPTPGAMYWPTPSYQTVPVFYQQSPQPPYSIQQDNYSPVVTPVVTSPNNPGTQSLPSDSKATTSWTKFD